MDRWRRVCALGIAASALWAGTALAQTVTRGPYLQLSTPSSVVVRWRTSTPTDSVVRYGTTLALELTAEVAESTGEHVVALSGLEPETSYYYAIGTSAGDLAGGDASYVFATPPPPALRGLDEGIARLGPAYSLLRAAIDLEVERERWDAALARSEALPEPLRQRPEWLARRGDWLLALGREAEARR